LNPELKLICIPDNFFAIAVGERSLGELRRREKRVVRFGGEEERVREGEGVSIEIKKKVSGFEFNYHGFAIAVKIWKSFFCFRFQLQLRSTKRSTTFQFSNQYLQRPH
jgi:hypothetical protein